MRGIELRAGEEFLGKGACSMMVGPLSVVGELTLTSERLHFEPNRLNRLAGLKPLTMKTAAITKLEVLGIDRVVTITDDQRTAKFIGKWPKTVLKQLQSIREGSSAETDSLDGFKVDERFLLQTHIDYSTSPIVMVGGDLTVTTRGIRFVPTGLERMMWRKLKVDVLLENIEDLELTGPRRMQFRVGDEVHRFAGAVATRAYAAIWATQEHSRLGLPSRELVFELRTASIERGVLTHPGVLVQTRDGLSFLVGGSLDTLLGIPRVNQFKWREIRRLDLGDTGKMVVTTEAGKTTLVIPRLAEMEQDFLLNFARSRAGSSKTIGLSDSPTEGSAELHDGAELVRELTEHWGQRIPDLSDQIPGVWGPAVRVSSRVGCLRGHVGVFKEHVLWVPEEGSASGLNPLVLSITQLRRVGVDIRATPDLRLRVGDSQLHLVPAAEDAFTVRFWEEVGERAAEITLNQREEESSPVESADVWDRRSTYRVGLPLKHHLPVQLRFLGTDRDKLVAARMMNLSLGGAGLASADLLPIGEKALLSFVFEEQPSLTFPATVIHSRRVGRRNLIFSGVEFGELNAVEVEQLRQLWTGCQRVEVQLGRGMSEKDIPPINVGSVPAQANALNEQTKAEQDD